MRGSGDLNFELGATGLGYDQYGEYQVNDIWRIHVPRPDRIKTLSQSKARNILRLALLLPLSEQPKKWADIARGLDSAEAQFRNGNYMASVAPYRTVFQGLSLGYPRQSHHRPAVAGRYLREVQLGPARKVSVIAPEAEEA